MAAKFEIATNADATAWEDITGLVNWETARFGGTADRGAIDTGSGFDLLDDAGTRTLPKRRRVRVTETDTAPDTIIWQGRTVGATLARGVIVTEDSKRFDIQLTDVNSDFGGIGFAGSPRPAETDIQRIQYLLDTHLQGQNRPSTDIADTYFSSGTPINLVAHTYEGVQPIDWFNHITESTGKQFFLTNLYELYYAVVNDTSYAAGISITDDGFDFSTSFPPGGPPQATEDGTEMFTRVRFRYKDNRLVTVVRSAVEAAHDRWGTAIVDESVASVNAATTRANRFLDEFDHEATTFQCYVDLPSTMVAELSWGMTISFRSAACGILSPTTFRVSRCSWQLITPGIWRAHLELNFPTKFGKRSVGGGSGNPGTPSTTGPVPFIPGDAAIIDVTLSIGSAGLGGGDRIIHYASQVGATLPTAVPGQEYRIVVDQLSDFQLSGGSFSFIDGANFNIWETAEGPGMATAWSPDNPYPYIADAPYTPGKHWETPWKEWTGGAVLFDASIGGTMISGFEGGFWECRLRLETRALGGTGIEEDPVGSPSLGQPVIESVGSDGTNDPGSPTTYPYAPLSLVILVNGVDMAAALTETDPTAGTYELLNPVPEGAEITRRYLGTGETF
jgi:hypothetical protein